MNNLKLVPSSKTGIGFITTGAIAGAGVSATVGGMGLAGAFGAVGIGANPLVGAGAVAGAATYGAFKAIVDGDVTAWGAIGVGAVLSVAISPDGEMFASGCVDRKISSWHLETKKYLGIFNYPCSSYYSDSPVSHNGFVSSIAFSPDNRIIASGSTDKTIRLWGRYTKELKRTFNGHSEAVLCICFSPDGKIIASGGADKTIRLWNLDALGQPQVLTGHLAAVQAVEISPDGKTVISGGTDSTIKIWSLATGELLRTLTAHQASIMSLAISFDGTILASASNNSVKLWNLATGELLQNLAGCNAVVFSPNGNTLVSCGKNGTVIIWNNKNKLITDPLLCGEWWEILGVEKDACADEVKQAYRNLARRYHPDVNATTKARGIMQAINKAYEEFEIKCNICS